MKKVLVKFVMGISIVAALSACGKKNEEIPESASANHPESSITAETHSIESTEESTKETESKKELWTVEQSTNLQSFIADWEKEMDQQYKTYGKGNDVNFYGLSIPKGLFEGQMKPKVGGQFVTMGWMNEQPNVDYKIVAVYSDIEATKWGAAHCYLFTVHKGNPVVLITMQNQGNNENAIVFTETENQALKNAFYEIFSGTYVHQEHETPVETSQLDEVTLEAIALLKGTYYEKATGNPAFSIDDEFYTDLKQERKFKIDHIDVYESDGNMNYSIAWDINEFEQRYGAGSAGPGPQAFMYKLYWLNGSDFVLGYSIEQSFTRNQMSAFTEDEALALANEHYENEEDDLAFLVFSELEKDAHGFYYKVKLVSRALVAGGGSGTVAIVNVYENGDIME